MLGTVGTSVRASAFGVTPDIIVTAVCAVCLRKETRGDCLNRRNWSVQPWRQPRAGHLVEGTQRAVMGTLHF